MPGQRICCPAHSPSTYPAPTAALFASLQLLLWFNLLRCHQLGDGSKNLPATLHWFLEPQLCLFLSASLAGGFQPGQGCCCSSSAGCSLVDITKSQWSLFATELLMGTRAGEAGTGRRGGHRRSGLRISKAKHGSGLQQGYWT